MLSTENDQGLKKAHHTISNNMCTGKWSDTVNIRSESGKVICGLMVWRGVYCKSCFYHTIAQRHNNENTAHSIHSKHTLKIELISHSYLKNKTNQDVIQTLQMMGGQGSDEGLDTEQDYCSAL